MLRNTIYSLAVLLSILAIGNYVQSAPITFPAGAAANLSRPCSHTGVTGSTGASTGSSAQANGSVTVGAVAMVTCFNNAWGAQGASGAVTAVVGTGIPITKNVPYWFVTETSGNYFAFIKQTGESDSTCSVLECR